MTNLGRDVKYKQIQGLLPRNRQQIFLFNNSIKTSMPNLLLADLSFKLRGIFFNISNRYGCLFKEKIYQNLLNHELRKKQIFFIQFPKLKLHDDKSGELIGHYYPDFLIENKIIIEIKAQEHLNYNHVNQLIKYLHSSKYEIGFIVNFGTPRVQIIRRIFTNDRKYYLK